MSMKPGSSSCAVGKTYLYGDFSCGAGLLSRTLWRNLESVGLHGEDRSSVTQSPDRLSSFFTFSTVLLSVRLWEIFS
jgi:hypothetical protein